MRWVFKVVDENPFQTDIPLGVVLWRPSPAYEVYNSKHKSKAQEHQRSDVAIRRRVDFAMVGWWRFVGAST